jgi:hypothetical protein
MKTYTRQEAAAVIGVCTRTLDLAREKGRIGFVSVGNGKKNRVIFRDCDLEAFLARHAVPAREDAITRTR